VAQEAPVPHFRDDKKDDIFGKTRVDDAANDAPLYKPFTLPTASNDLARPKEILPIHETGAGALGLPPPGPPAFEMP